MVRQRSRRSMDRMPPSEGGDAGSIPAESTRVSLRKVLFAVVWRHAPVVQWIGYILAEDTM
jgi:hypothetical protein